MVVVVVSSVPDGLRGYLSRYLYEVASGVYVGGGDKRKGKGASLEHARSL